MKRNSLFRIGAMVVVLALVFVALNLVPAQAAALETADANAVAHNTTTTTSTSTTTSSSSASSTTEEDAGHDPKKDPKEIGFGLNSKGNCATYLVNYGGSGAQLWNQGVQHLTVGCEVRYADGTGPLAGWVYVKLNAYTAKQFEKGNLGLQMQTSTGWETCSNPLVINEGNHGMLACYTNAVTVWGLGKVSK